VKNAQQLLATIFAQNLMNWAKKEGGGRIQMTLHQPLTVTYFPGFTHDPLPYNGRDFHHCVRWLARIWHCWIFCLLAGFRAGVPVLLVAETFCQL